MEEKDPKIDLGTKDQGVMNSRNKMNQDDQDKVTNAEEGTKIKEENFAYLAARVNEETSVFEFKSKKNQEEAEGEEVEEENIFKKNASTCKYAICVLLKEDGDQDSELLKSTLDGIKSNLGDLGELGIECKDILIYVFVSKIKQKELVSEEDIKNNLSGENRNKYLLTHLKLKDDERDFKIEVISKKNYMSEIESLKCFYCQIVKGLKTDKNILITSILTAGVTPKTNALSDLIKASLNNNNDPRNRKKNYDCVVVPALEIDEKMKNEGLFSNVIKYERVHFNIYNMNTYYSTGMVPVLSLMNTMAINKEIMNSLIMFYGNFDILEGDEMPKIDYHDYSLGLHFYQNKINIKYLGKESFGTIYYRDFDYKNVWVSKYSGYYSNFFGILKSFTNFELPILHKIFLVFQIIGMLIEFIYPGLSILVVSSIFIEAFDNSDFNPAWFMTLLYIIMYLGSGVSSLISNKSKDLKYTNLIYYYFMEVYYLFILVCSIPAMDNIKKKKFDGRDYETVESFYEFNEAACACLIIFTFLIAIIPMIFRISMITENIVPMLLYFVLGAPMSTSNFLIAKIWNAPGASGGKNIDDKKGLIILFFFLFNLFFGFLSAYNYDRELRAKCVMGLAIFYLLYLFFKVIGIISSLLGTPDLTKIKPNKIKYILSGENIYQSKNSSEHLGENEEKLDNDVENENKNDNENYNENQGEDYNVRDNEEIENNEEAKNENES